MASDLESIDPYTILGINNNATDDEIKTAYHNLALIHHPDKHKDSPDATAIFQKINRANEILTNPKLKAEWLSLHRSAPTKKVPPVVPLVVPRVVDDMKDSIRLLSYEYYRFIVLHFEIQTQKYFELFSISDITKNTVIKSLETSKETVSLPDDFNDPNYSKNLDRIIAWFKMKQLDIHPHSNNMILSNRLIEYLNYKQKFAPLPSTIDIEMLGNREIFHSLILSCWLYIIKPDLLPTSEITHKFPNKLFSRFDKYRTQLDPRTLPAIIQLLKQPEKPFYLVVGARGPRQKLTDAYPPDIYKMFDHINSNISELLLRIVGTQGGARIKRATKRHPRRKSSTTKRPRRCRTSRKPT
jgi:curved DNA-binding protein CbpA